MKIYSLYYTHKPGGFCKRLYRLLNALAVDGHQVTYLSLDKPPPSLALNVNWYQIPFPIKVRSGFLFWSLFSIWATLFCLWISFCQGQAARWIIFSPYYASILAPSRLLLGNPLICFIRSKLSHFTILQLYLWISCLLDSHLRPYILHIAWLHCRPF